MRMHIELFSIIGLLASLAAADAQTPPPPPAGGAFDGKYRLVSSARVNPTFMTRKAGGPMSGPQTGAARGHAGSGAV